MGMMRRLLIALSVTAAVLGVGILVIALWLGGRPLSPSSGRGPTVFSAPRPAELIRPSTAPIGGFETPQEELQSREEPTPDGPPLPIVRTESGHTPPLRWTQNILLVGIDRRYGRKSGGRTDTIVVAVMDRTSDHVGLVSIPRDLYVNVPDHGPARINAAYVIGQRQRRNGLAVLERVVEDTLSIPIHHKIAVDLAGFERSIDALGGVMVSVPCPIQDNFVDERMPSGRRMLDVQAGRRHMDGRTALMYVRSRHGRSDWDRARRQQAVMLGARDRLFTASGLGRIPDLWDELSESIATDMSRLEMIELAQRAAETDTRHVHGLVLGHRHTEAWVTPQNRWVLLPQFEAIDEALSDLFSAPTPGARPGHVRCPAADVALTRPDRTKLRRRLRELQQMPSPYSSSEDTGSNSDHSSSPPSP